MSVTNPAPVAISGDTWSVEGGIRSFTVNIPTEPVDNDLAGVIIIASTTGDPEYDAEGSDVFYKGPWQEYITVTTDANNELLIPEQIYRVGIAAYDQFGSAVANVDFGGTFKDVVSLQVVEEDIATDAVTTEKVEDEAITDDKISSLTVGKLRSGEIYAEQKIYSGAGNFCASDTPFYFDADGQFSLKDKLSWNGTTLGITGTVTATSGYIGGTTSGWSIGSQQISSGNVTLSAVKEQILMGSATSPIVGTGIFIGKDGSNYEFRVGDYTGGTYMLWNGSSLALNNSVVTNMDVNSDWSVQGWSHNLVFSATDNDTVAWTAGSIVVSGATKSIVAGNTGSMSAVTYIYLNKDVSETVLQTTTTASDASGQNKLLVAVAENATSGVAATYQVFGGQNTGLGKTVTADNIASDTITANEIATNTITAAEIASETITTTEIAADAITSQKIDVSQLSAITADMGSITAGDMTLDGSGFLKGGATSYASGAGFWMGYHLGAYKFRIGQGAGGGQNLIWTGSNLNITGNVKTSAVGSTAHIELNTTDNRMKIWDDSATPTEVGSFGFNLNSSYNNVLIELGSTSTQFTNIVCNSNQTDKPSFNTKKDSQCYYYKDYTYTGYDTGAEQICSVNLAERAGTTAPYNTYGQKIVSYVSHNTVYGTNYGGYFLAASTSLSNNSKTHQYGVYGSAINDSDSGYNAYGVYGVASIDSGGTGTAYAGYFDGDTHITGDLIVDGSIDGGTVNYPVFRASYGTIRSNMTTGTWYTMDFDADENQDFNYEADFNDATSTFTAPSAGIYRLHAQIRLNDLTSLVRTAILSIVTTSYEYRSQIGVADSDNQSISVDCLAEMAANDTAVVKVYISGSNSVDVTPVSGSHYGRFEGFRIQ